MESHTMVLKITEMVVLYEKHFRKRFSGLL
jgi:hypothetical protein